MKDIQKLIILILPVLILVRCGGNCVGDNCGLVEVIGADVIKDAVDTSTPDLPADAIPDSAEGGGDEGTFDGILDITQEIIEEIIDIQETSEEKLEDVQEDTDTKQEVIDVQDTIEVSEIIEPVKTGYRITFLEVKEPGFCLMGNNCMDITPIVNQSINDAINYCSDFAQSVSILDILGIFTVSGNSLNPEVSLSFGNAICECNGKMGKFLSCMLDPEDYPVNYENITYKSEIMSSICSSDPQIIPECFVTPAKDMALSIMGAVFGFKNAVIAGHFEDAFKEGDMITGIIKGFMPEKTAKQILISVPNPYLDPPTIEIQLDKVLPPDKKVTIDGLSGWNFLIDFKAQFMPIMDEK